MVVAMVMIFIYFTDRHTLRLWYLQTYFSNYRSIATMKIQLWKSNYMDIKTHISFFFYIIRVSEWLLFNVNSTIFQLYHGENKFYYMTVIKHAYDWLKTDSEVLSTCDITLSAKNRSWQVSGKWYHPRKA
jgi:hypothetical protein